MKKLIMKMKVKMNSYRTLIKGLKTIAKKIWNEEIDGKRAIEYAAGYGAGVRQKEIEMMEEIEKNI